MVYARVAEQQRVARLHGVSVWILVALTIVCLLLGWMHRCAPLRRWALILLIVELCQGAIGYAQYFAHLDPWLVGLHMVGVTAAAMTVGALWSSVRPLRSPDLAPRPDDQGSSGSMATARKISDR